jgi:prepilin-type N-terminal cleavage/methylation domain-containing protein
MKLNKKGFTMVELLVVLLIIGILAAVATPMYLANTNRAKASEAVATMGMIRQAEREYYTRHGSYLAIATTVLDNDPGDTPPGLGIKVGIPQYFGNPCYVVNIGGTDAAGNPTPPTSVSGKFTAPNNPQNFVIYVNGALNTGTNDAVKYLDVAKFKLEMDDTGRIYVTYDNGTTWVEY